MTNEWDNNPPDKSFAAFERKVMAMYHELEVIVQSDKGLNELYDGLSMDQVAQFLTDRTGMFVWVDDLINPIGDRAKEKFLKLWDAIVEVEQTKPDVG